MLCFWKKLPRLNKFFLGGKKVLTDYAKETTIHGFRYLCEENLVTCFFWLISLILSILGCSFLIIQVYNKWQQNPVIVSVNEKSTPVWTIPFPAITICPEIKFRHDLPDLSSIRFNKHQDNFTDEQIKLQNVLFPVCPRSYPIKSTSKIDYSAELSKIAFKNTFGVCIFREYIESCNTLIPEVLTDNGICYTFNMMNYNDLYTANIDESMKYPKHTKSSSNWTLQDGYKTFEFHTYPQRVLGSGLVAGLNVMLIGNKLDLEYRCRGYSQGFKIAFHSPNEIPRFSKQYYRISFNREVLINLNPQVVVTSNELKSYKPEVRKCYLDGEKTLKYFKSYTKSNCELECLSNFTQLTCGCVKLGMPFDNQTEICSFENMDCASSTELTWMNLKLNCHLSGMSDCDCGCLPSCNSIQYNADVSEGPYSTKEYSKIMNLESSNDKYVSNIFIYFKNDFFVALKRTKFYGWTDFISYCGGLLGLFMGFSILSIVEVVYHLTLRWIIAKKNSRVEPAKGINNQWVSTIQ